MAIGTVIVLVAYVLPKFKTFFKSFDAKLPLPTRMLLGVSDFLERLVAVIVARRRRRGRRDLPGRRTCRPSAGSDGATGCS